jgi:Stealth protein CR2, conserved region 2/Stealth protein CR3, conserved region 3/Stealth protein CR1, conserved region 1
MLINSTAPGKSGKTQSSGNRTGDFPVDIVYTWVNQSDPAWIEKRKQTLADNAGSQSHCMCLDGIREKEFEVLDELRFSLRSVSRYAGFVRKIFIVTDDQVPAWLNQGNAKIEIVSHREIFGEAGPLPCFNSHAIEARLHHIPGLAEHFLYLNDDFFLGRSVTAADFFQDNEVSRFFPSPRKIDPAPVSASDLAISSAAKRGQALLKKRFGKTVSSHILHAPYPLRRSVLFEMENIFPGEFAATAAHQFRHQQDHSIAAFLYFYYARFTDRAIPEKIRHMYLDNRLHQFVRKVLLTLLTGRYQTFCINGGHTAPGNNGIKLKLLGAFLKLRFPKKCEFELA